MIKSDIAEMIITKSEGIARTADFIAAGLTSSDVSELCNEGHIERIRHGYYKLPGSSSPSDEKLLSTLLPEGIICVESALFHYGYSDYTPRLWTVAVPRTFSRTRLRIDGVPLKIYYIQKDLYMLGKTTETFNGIHLSIYDRERTICDCFKYRTRLDHELFNKAINAYIADDKKNLRTLSEYGKTMHLDKKIMDLMEVILNG